MISLALILSTIFFKNSFFPSTLIEWNKLDDSLRKCDSFNVFKKEVLKFIRPSLIPFAIATILLGSNISQEFDLV